MKNFVIQADGLSKSYRIGRNHARYKTLRETITDLASAPVRRLRASLRGNAAAEHDELIWVLKDVSFSIEQGEIVGIIGRNGAGKSTLLKILSRITQPTEGSAVIRGRVGSLLEVGTGFHPELTGRENIFLNGAILGMRRAEINRKFDEMVNFSEVEKFLDTPVKHYSSGMYMRLAFAVAAHLETEVLLVDEVLAVGDAAFQRKCLSKMDSISSEGRTILFVSHNLGAINKLCSKTMLISEGKMLAFGETENVINEYCSNLFDVENGVELLERDDRSGNGRIRFTQIYWQDDTGQNVGHLVSGKDYNLVLEYSAPKYIDGKVQVSFALKDYQHNNLILHHSDFNDDDFESVPASGKFICQIPKLPLAQGRYLVNIYVGIDGVESDSINDASSIAVEYGNYFGTGHPGRPELCHYLSDCRWIQEKLI